MFVNTYHQLVQPPGVDVIGAAGGLHAFMNFDKPLFTDSGGFQVFSLGQQHNDDDNDDDSTTTMIDVTKPELKGQQRGRYEASVSRLSEEGVLFKSYLNGDEIMLTPESSVEAQQKLGADIIVPLDELPSNNVSKQRIHQSLLRTNRWQLRSLATHRRRDLSSTSNDQQSMYGVVHGGVHHDLRKQSIDFVVKQTFEGIAVGGSLGIFSVSFSIVLLIVFVVKIKTIIIIGSSRQEMYELLEQCVMPTIHEADDDALRRPIHLLGIGDTPSIVRLVTQGIDTFDSAYPSRCGRHGTLLRFDHNSNVRNNTNYNNDFPRRYNNNNDDNNFENNDNNDVDNQYPFDNDNFQLPSISSFKATSSELGIHVKKE